MTKTAMVGTFMLLKISVH